MMVFLVSGTKKEMIEIIDSSIKLGENDEVIVSYIGPKGAYALVSDNQNVSINSGGWKITEDNSYAFAPSKDIKHYYLKYKNKTYYVGTNKDLGYVEIKKGTYDKYLAVGDDRKIDYEIVEHGYVEDTNISWHSDDIKIISVKDGNVHGLFKGEASVKLTVNDKTETFDFVVSDLIEKMPDEFNVKKELLPCGRYTKEENDLLDEILKSRIENAGYKTRGGVIASSRFLLLEFPYRLTYFYEYGRQAEKVDGEGRYYKQGLYLDESRFSNLIGSRSGPKTWGCDMYSGNIKTISPNGLDCSGFVSWILYNAGFDCGDIGAGDTPAYDLCNTGKMVKSSKETIKQMKVGDLLHSNYMGGHIGIVVGTKDDYIYVGQATPNKNWGVTITKYKEKEFLNEWSDIVLMDSYYKEEGNYNNYWN